MGESLDFWDVGRYGSFYIYVVPEMAGNVAELRGEAMAEAEKTC